MFMSRALRKAISRMLIGIMLFAQLAVSSYACPGLSGTASPSRMGAATMVTAMDNAASQSTSIAHGCDQIDQDSANLCTEHCKQGQQSADTATAPLVHAAAPALLYELHVQTEAALGFGRAFPALEVSRVAAPPPPHAILHCVFRI